MILREEGPHEEGEGAREASSNYKKAREFLTFARDALLNKQLWPLTKELYRFLGIQFPKN